MAEELYAEIVRIRPKPGTEQRLLEMRDPLVQSYRDNFPGFVSCRLLRPEEGDTWVDLWYWKRKSDAEEALADTSKTPLFEEWGKLVDMVQFEWAEVLADH
jgi:hypothetical protein